MEPKNLKHFFAMLVWIAIYVFVINFIIDVVNNLWTSGPNLRLWFNQPYSQITQAVTPAAPSTTGAGGSGT